MAQRSIRNASCSAAVMDRGATITSWHPIDGHELLFVSSQASAEHEFHGGIPLCAPWFGRGQGDWTVPHNHGLVRYMDWEFLGAKELRDATVLTWELAHAAVAHLPGSERYPQDLHYRYTARFGASLDVALTITSPTSAVSIDAAFHTYYLVNNVAQARVLGVTKDPLIITEHYDEVHPGVGQQPISIELPDRIIRIQGRGVQDAIVWNPGPQTASSFPHFEATQWPRMLCVELGNVQGNAVTIEPGGSLTMGMTLEMESRTPRSR